MRGEVSIRELVERLESVHGRMDWQPRYDPVDELVSCILSQHSNDKISFPAFDRLKARYPDWQMVLDAGPVEVADVVRAAGLANQKSRNIIACLQKIKEATGSFSLEMLRGMTDEEAREWLLKLPGVGQKTAAIVLSFALGRDIVPVDTHVFRVSWRIGLISRESGEAKAHALLAAMVPDGLSYRFHMALINHGRAVCKAPRPVCPVCPVTDLCEFYLAMQKAEYR